jgi:NADH-quinone oxidoreductase subunit D
MARSCGIRRDLRLSIKDSYSGYNKLFFKGYYGINGDCFDRYLIRMLEMAESLQLVNVVSYNLLQDNVNLSSLSYLNNLFYNKKNVDSYSVMEDLINHFLQ